MSDIKVSILLPTYNEANNVASIIRALSKAMRESFDSASKEFVLNYEILFIDDSPDEATADEVRRLQKTYPEVRLVRRAKKDRTGLATAFVAGFREARGKYILCMDSDLQHPPEVAPHLIRAIEEGDQDLIVASRYIKGGGADGLGTFYRKLASRVSRRAAWMVLPVTRKTTDPGSGFFILTKELATTIPFHGLRGFKILIDILARAPLARVGEVPYVFARRENEVSKATLTQGTEFLRHIFYLRQQAFAPQEEQATRTERDPSWRFTFYHYLPDSLALFGIAAVGWLLIGYFSGFAYLYTGYEDWLYHAFRVQSIERHGFPSWDHVWSNGINFWRMYQYIQHTIIFGIVQVTGWPITNVLVASLIMIYIGLRLALYLLLRAFRVHWLIALAVTMASYTMVQEWGSMQDYSIYLAFVAVPLYVMLWIKTYNDLRWIYVLTAVTGALWTVHPVLGFSMSLLYGFLILFSKVKSRLWQMSVLAVIYGLSALPFLAPYLTTGYSFTNPIFKSSVYLTLSVLAPAGGLSLIYWSLLVGAWLLVIWKARVIDRAAQILLFFCTFYLLLIYLGQNFYLPTFLVQFQFSRGLPAIAFVFVIALGIIASRAFAPLRSRFLAAALVGFTGISIAQAIDVASGYYVPIPVHSIDNVVARHFDGQPIPKGSIYYDNVSEASYLAPEGLRYATSYNEHLQPHPFSSRLRLLTRGSVAYTGIAETHIKNLEDYATVLGIEYYFLPRTSPLVKGLVQSDQSVFTSVAVYDSEYLSDDVSVLRALQPVIQAYLVEQSVALKYLVGPELKQPTLHTASYQPWDRAVAEAAALMRSDLIKPVPLNFQATDRLKVDLSGTSLEDFSHPMLIIHQSYDQNWRVQGAPQLTPAPTLLRFMSIDLDNERDRQTVVLRNTWPRWHWPVQTMGIAMVGMMLVHRFLSRPRKPLTY